jgi:hypothetical protein
VAPDVEHGFGGKNCDVCLPFVVEKVVGRGTRKKPLVIEVDFPGRTLRYRYPDGRKPTFQRPHHTLLQVWTTLHARARVCRVARVCVVRVRDDSLLSRVCVCVCYRQVLRSHVNEKKLKLLWSGREKFERLLLPSREQRERFYEGTTLRPLSFLFFPPNFGFIFLAFRPADPTPSPPIWVWVWVWGAPAAWAVRRDRGGGDSVEVFVGTWNMGNAPPQKSLGAWLQPEANYDLYAISAQEVNSETDLFKLVQVPYVRVRVRSCVCGRACVRYGTRVCAVI